MKMNNLKDKFKKIVPVYAIFSLIFILLFNQTIYTGTQFLMKNAHHYVLTIPMDKYIPFSSWWITIYLVCYIYWVVNYILIAKQGKEKWYRFVTADLLAKTISGIIFILLPTTIVRPGILGNNVFDKLTRYIYNSDMPTNLFPSIHCLASWLCYIGIKNDSKTPKWYKTFSFVFTLLIFASTQFTKQHYLLDILGGVAIAQTTYYISQNTNIYKGVMRCFEGIINMLKGKNNKGENNKVENQNKKLTKKDSRIKKVS